MKYTKTHKMKHVKAMVVIIALTLLLTACSTASVESKNDTATKNDIQTEYNAVEIALSDNGIKVDGKSASKNSEDAVYTANDIIYYESGKDFTYGEGTEMDAHSKDEADAHTVVHITKAGAYSISGKLSKGQIAIDLGDGAKENPEAVVTLILNGADITCEVAPAVIFYNVYECGNTDTEKATKDVDTSKAGANVIIADGTANNINGSYVARIYKPGTVVLNDDKTEVEDADKLHKYDGAFYSKMSMNINGDKNNQGILNIKAENEGLDSELHLTINGGKIRIESGNDGINTNEDEVSVTTINGGDLDIKVTGETGEGDGIDSNGWLVINGGIVTASACATSGDAGIDSDMGIHINGGSVIASGHMLDRIENGGQNYAVFNFAEKQKGTDVITIKTESGDDLMKICPRNDCSVLIFSNPELVAGTYTLWSEGKQLAGQSGGMMGGQGMKPDDFDYDDEMPEDIFDPKNFNPEDFKKPEDFQIPEGEKPQRLPDDAERPEKPNGENGGMPNSNNINLQELSKEFKIVDGGNMFNGVTYAE